MIRVRDGQRGAAMPPGTSAPTRILPASWLAGKRAPMKTTLDLPQQLVRQLKLRAVRDGRKLKDVAADALRAGLAVRAAPSKDKAVRIARDRKTGLPVVVCRHPATRGGK